MSGAADAVVFSQSAMPGMGTAFTPLIPTLAIGVGGALVLFGAGRLAYMTAQHLDLQYQQAMAEFRARGEDEIAALHAAQGQSRLQMRQALQNVTVASRKAEVDANAEFLRASLQRMRGRLGEGADVPPDLPAQLAALDALIENGAANLSRVSKELEKLQSQVGDVALRRLALYAETNARPDEKKAAQMEHVREELALLRHEFENPLWQRGDGIAERERLLARLEALEQLLDTQPATVAQGLALLQSAVGRARDLLAAHEDARRRKIAEKAALVRDYSGAIAARGQALSSIEDDEARELGGGVLSKLSAILSKRGDNEVEELRALVQEAETVFAATQKRLSDAALAAFVQLQVADVLSELGYRVQTVEGDGEPTSLMAMLDGDNGVQIRVGEGGHLHSELVAIGAEDGEVPADRWTQERACTLVDQIYDGLRSRKLEIKERKRKTLRSGDKVRRVARKAAREESLIGATQSAPKAMTLD